MHLDLDIRTLSIVSVLVSTAYGIGMLMLKAIQTTHIRGLQTLVFAIFLIVFGFLALSFGNSTTFWLSKILANSAIGLGYALIVAGLSQFRQASSNSTTIALAGFPVLVLYLIFYSEFQMSTNSRIIVLSMYISLCCALNAYVVARGEAKDHPIAVRLLSTAFSLMSLWMLFRAVFTYQSAEIDDFMLASDIHQITFLLSIAMILTLGFTFPLMVNARLVTNIYNTSLLDPLTNLYNRRAMEDMVPRELSRVERNHSELSIILLDIDHFKQVNDKYGHQVGDVTLAGIGQLLNTHLRGQDLSFRIGGEEFLILLPDTNLDSALVVAEKLRQIMAEMQFSPKQQEPCTASFGVAQLLQHDEWDSLLNRADAALYLAKRKGRNRVCLVSDI
ncbi:GGDEF domain-containing protein [Vibrio navarrensis]|uniref:GGDEF domain-containing protein n=2 Tax=Vibrio navarrensis TaxID=29495 RepID=UPI001868FA05|nr:GGDEF domain-containing protein [Vibrio navarrensis]MBE3663922.1 GGDEF domain-containing protein [Vibrio navarrensis]MBE4607669.1 GGDEF domain-containing protein [Vibrio navarrensis]MBE4610752.1 GGDEF domain-containing protein [Vibrio navarrensis]